MLVTRVTIMLIQEQSRYQNRDKKGKISLSDYAFLAISVVLRYNVRYDPLITVHQNRLFMDPYPTYSMLRFGYAELLTPTP
jgi:hypothetical protein